MGKSRLVTYCNPKNRLPPNLVQREPKTEGFTALKYPIISDSSTIQDICASFEPYGISYDVPPPLIPIMVYEIVEGYVVEAQVPSFKAKDITVQILGSGNQLNLKGSIPEDKRHSFGQSKKIYSFDCHVTFPDQIEMHTAIASVEDGLLSITLKNANRDGVLISINVPNNKNTFK